MSNAISTALLVIATVVASVAMFNAIFPAMGRSSSALLSANKVASDQVKTSLDIVFVSGDTVADTVTFWAKNVGTTNIDAISSSDVFLVTPTTFKRLPYGSGAEYWTYTIEESAAEWSQSVTVKVTVTLTDLAAGNYTVQMVTPNGVSAQKDFSV